MLLAPFSPPRGRMIQLHEKERETKRELDQEELDQLNGEALPERAAMSTIQWDLSTSRRNPRFRLKVSVRTGRYSRRDERQGIAA